MPGVVPLRISSLQEKIPGNELIRDLYFYFTYKKNLGWKHSRVNPFNILKKYAITANKKLCILTITKNPYSWLLSLHRRPYHQYYSTKPDFETFLTSPWKTVQRDNTDKKIYPNPVAIWNIKNASYLQLSNLKKLNITTESMFEDPEAVINKIADQFSISKLSNKFVNYERSTKDKNKDSNYYRDYYLNERWRDDMSKNTLSLINKSVDQKIMSHFGYKILS